LLATLEGNNMSFNKLQVYQVITFHELNNFIFDSASVLASMANKFIILSYLKLKTSHVEWTFYIGSNQQFLRTRSRTGPEAGGHCLRLPKLQKKRKEKFDKKVDSNKFSWNSFFYNFHLPTTFLHGQYNNRYKFFVKNQHISKILIIFQN